MSHRSRHLEDRRAGAVPPVRRRRFAATDWQRYRCGVCGVEWLRERAATSEGCPCTTMRRRVPREELSNGIRQFGRKGAP